MKNKQQGFAMIYVIGILVLTLGGIGTMLYMERQSMVKKVAELEVNLASSQAALVESVKENVKLASINESLLTQLETQKKLVEAAAVEIKKHQIEGQKLKLAFNNILKSLPKPLSKVDEPLESPQSIQVAHKRSLSLWEAYCTKNAVDVACTPKGNRS